MSRSVEDLLMTLDRVDAPDQWSDIVARGDAGASTASGESSDVEVETAPLVVASLNTRKRGDMDRKGWMRGLAAVAAAAVVVIAVVAVADRDDDDPDAGSTTTSPPATGDTLPKPFDEAAALQVSDAYFDAYNGGDIDALLAMFAVDATYAPGDGSTIDRAAFEALMSWQLSQGVVLGQPECDASEVEVGAVVRVVCRHDHYDAIVQAVDGPPVPIALELTVTQDDITKWANGIGQPDFFFIGDPFDRWMIQTHPDVAAQVGFGAWESVAEAEANGLLTARYAAESAAYLEANGCLDRDDPLAADLRC